MDARARRLGLRPPSPRGTRGLAMILSLIIIRRRRRRKNRNIISIIAIVIVIVIIFMIMCSAPVFDDNLPVSAKKALQGLGTLPDYAAVSFVMLS